jgi:four helix bundle protein
MTNENDLLSHEKLKAYQVAIALDVLVGETCERAERGHASLLDQIRRASESTVLNLVEANGRTGADRVNHLKISKGSALEVDAAFALCLNRKLVTPMERLRAHQMAVELVRLLSGLIRQ